MRLRRSAESGLRLASRRLMIELQGGDRAASLAPGGGHLLQFGQIARGQLGGRAGLGQGLHDLPAIETGAACHQGHLAA